jgi:hypothetical protein
MLSLASMSINGKLVRKKGPSILFFLSFSLHPPRPSTFSFIFAFSHSALCADRLVRSTRLEAVELGQQARSRFSQENGDNARAFFPAAFQ